ncbi:MAG TPA: ribose-phosphate diphosphokinase, partial [Gammaproteobacteria bacterium]|nr:ribose-phosphate diphosphokinase [Gammaproteobacteria bacterium]
VFVIASLYAEPGQSPNDKLCRLLFFIGALKDAAAESVTAVIPYLCYARKDRRTKSRDPVTSRYVAQLLEAAGADRTVTMDVHNLAAFQNAFRRPTEHLEARRLFVEYLVPLIGDRECAVVSPDIGGVKRAEYLRQGLGARLERAPASAFMKKQRSSGVVSGERVVGDVAGRVAVIVDDMISTGGTIARTARACRALGAAEVHAVATHGLFVDGAPALLESDDLRAVAVTNTVPAFRVPPRHQGRVAVVDAADLFGAAIGRIHAHGSIVDLLEV